MTPEEKAWLRNWRADIKASTMEHADAEELEMSKARRKRKAETGRLRYQANKEKIQAQHRAWNLAHPEKQREYDQRSSAMKRVRRMENGEHVNQSTTGDSMSLRRPRGESWEQPLTPTQVEASFNKAHQLTRYGSMFACRCGCVFSTARSQRDAILSLAVHKRATKELLEDRQKGVSYYDE
jgi:hypothetical protein